MPRPMGRSRTPSLGLVDEAALALHQPHLSAAEVRSLLVKLVGELGLAKEPRYLPADAGVPSPDNGLLSATVECAAPISLRTLVDGVLWYRPVHDDVARHVESLAAHAGLALTAVARRDEMARREESVRRIAEKLQDALLPRLPVLESTLLAVEYRAAGQDTRVGGDFYDVFALPDGRVLIVVGDVMGKGVEAASRTSRITHTLRALALQGLELDALLARVDEQVTFQDPEVMATVWCGLYVPATGELDFASLGHPPALLVREGKDPIHLTLEGLPLGLRDLTEDPPECRDRQLASRDLLVLYTDGVIEATRDILYGLQALGDAARAVAQYPAHFMARGIVERALAGAAHRDDSLALILRHRVLAKPARAVLGPFHYRFSPSTATVPLARHLFADWLGYQPVDPIHRGDLLFVATELCTNAVRAASGAPGSVELRASIDRDAVVIEVEDDGGGLVVVDSGRVLAPPAEDESGRGLFLVGALTDELEIFRRNSHTVARCVKRAALVPS